MPEPPVNQLQYASEERDERLPISPLRLGVACTIWSLPFTFAILMLSFAPPEPICGAVLVVMGIPLAIACSLAGLTMLHGRRGYLATVLILVLLLLPTAWLLFATAWGLVSSINLD